jgi:hypothetical protein
LWLNNKQTEITKERKVDNGLINEGGIDAKGFVNGLQAGKEVFAFL